MPRSTSKSSQPTERNVALDYVRQSVTRNADDRTSPERQRANILAACNRYGWVAEWYEDATGHKSATKEENRPAWIALKARLKEAMSLRSSLTSSRGPCAMRGGRSSCSKNYPLTASNCSWQGWTARSTLPRLTAA